MTVHFIGVGPGAPDLITLRARDIIAAADIILYAGSLIPTEILGHAHESAVKINSAPLDLDAITAVYAEADKHGQDVDTVAFWGFVYLVSHGRSKSPS